MNEHVRKIIRSIGPYDFDITDDEADAIWRQANEAVAPSIISTLRGKSFDGTGRDAREVEYIVPLIDHISQQKAALKEKKLVG